MILENKLTTCVIGNDKIDEQELETIFTIPTAEELAEMPFDFTLSEFAMFNGVAPVDLVKGENGQRQYLGQVWTRNYMGKDRAQVVGQRSGYAKQARLADRDVFGVPLRIKNPEQMGFEVIEKDGKHYLGYNGELCYYPQNFEDLDFSDKMRENMASGVLGDNAPLERQKFLAHSKHLAFESHGKSGMNIECRQYQENNYACFRRSYFEEQSMDYNWLKLGLIRAEEAPNHDIQCQIICGDLLDVEGKLTPLEQDSPVLKNKPEEIDIAKTSLGRSLFRLKAELARSVEFARDLTNAQELTRN